MSDADRPADRTLGWTGLALAVVGCVPVLPSVGLVVGAVTLARGRFRPLWVPVAAVLLGLGFTAAQALVAVDGWGEEDPPRDRSKLTGDLATGDCFNDPAMRNIENLDRETAQALGEVQVVACTSPHEFEVFAMVEVGRLRYPGEDALARQAERCLPRFRHFVGLPYGDSVLDIYNFLPAEEGWPDDRSIVCVVATRGVEPVTSSLEGARR